MLRINVINSGIVFISFLVYGHNKTLLSMIRVLYNRNVWDSIIEHLYITLTWPCGSYFGNSKFVDYFLEIIDNVIVAGVNL